MESRPPDSRKPVGRIAAVLRCDVGVLLRRWWLRWVYRPLEREVLLEFEVTQSVYGPLWIFSPKAVGVRVLVTKNFVRQVKLVLWMSVAYAVAGYVSHRYVQHIEEKYRFWDEISELNKQPESVTQEEFERRNLQGYCWRERRTFTRDELLKHAVKSYVINVMMREDTQIGVRKLPYPLAFSEVSPEIDKFVEDPKYLGMNREEEFDKAFTHHKDRIRVTPQDSEIDVQKNLLFNRYEILTSDCCEIISDKTLESESLVSDNTPRSDQINYHYNYYSSHRWFIGDVPFSVYALNKTDWGFIGFHRVNDIGKTGIGNYYLIVRPFYPSHFFLQNLSLINFASVAKYHLISNCGDVLYLPTIYGSIYGSTRRAREFLYNDQDKYIGVEE